MAPATETIAGPGTVEPALAHKARAANHDGLRGLPPQAAGLFLLPNVCSIGISARATSGAAKLARRCFAAVALGDHHRSARLCGEEIQRTRAWAQPTDLGCFNANLEVQT